MRVTVLVLHCCFFPRGSPRGWNGVRTGAHTSRCVHSKSVLLIPLSFLPSIYSSIHPVLYLFYTLLPNANRFVFSPLNSGSSTRPRMCRFVREGERGREGEMVSNRAQVLICHQRAAELSLCCQSSSPGDKHSASNTQSRKKRADERWLR